MGSFATCIALGVSTERRKLDTIYWKTFTQMKRIGDVLLTLGYREAVKKPNLFYFRAGPVSFFADMRGTEIVPIWEDTRPLFWWRFQRPLPLRARQIMVYIQWRRLAAQGLEPRLATIMDMESTEEAEILEAWEYHDQRFMSDHPFGLRFLEVYSEYCEEEYEDREYP